jgi:hypothetical protein
MTNIQFHEVEIRRYRQLEREVTDPLAICLLNVVIADLEADLQRLHRQTPQ